ncbi:HNH endonuclease [Nocardioides terrisoli]|uniref:HNH endonuclease n=1 Tax=Nocardioides terrisoli TaxID=3388267 RepID=UPI00287BB88B|nr:HNH endonuclease signature motif containing protein [Nocardioides marmorisolisilvae]
MPYRYAQPGNWKTTRRRILQRDEGRCYSPYPALCIGEATQVDHVQPVAAGGSHDDDNLAAICAPCHDAKSKAERMAGVQRVRHARHRPPEPHPGAI